MSTLLLLLLMVVGVSEAWGQTDYSGTYYIASKSTKSNQYNYNPETPSNNYYLCPTEGWAFYKATNDVQGVDNGQPFLTTYKCRDGNYTAAKAIWIVEKESNSGCYYIKQALTVDGKYKYMVSNGVLTEAGNTRARVHLETVANADALTSLGDWALFEIKLDGDHYDILPHSTYGRDGNNIYLVVNTNNYNQLDGSNVKTNGPKGFKNCGGIIGLYTHPDEGNAYFYLEDVVAQPTITIDALGQVTITAEAGTTIRYTTDGTTNPTATTGTPYTTTFPLPDGATTIKAVAVKTINTVEVTSKVATASLPAYTYNIVDTQGHIAIKYTVNQLPGTQLTDYTSIPEAIRSPYIEGETITFYSTFTEGSRDNLSDENAITETPAEGGDIYVSYTTGLLGNKPLHLAGARPFQIQINGQYVYERNGQLRHKETAEDANTYMWKVAGNDPYRVYIQNLGNTSHYFRWETSPTTSVALAASPSYFIVFGGSATVPDDYIDQVELMAATGADIRSGYYNLGRDGLVDLLASDTYGQGHADIQVLLKAVTRNVTFHIIDKSGHIVVEERVHSDGLDVPEQWKSPLVQTYHFYTHENFRVENGVYTLKAHQTEIDNFINAPNDIYVTYDVSDEYDLNGSENRDTDGKKYLLKFAGGTSFKQENGDGFEATPAEGIYPYINGEGGLFVYGQDKLDATEGAVGSTRTRWAWYLEGGDPYRLRISSLQTKTDGIEETHHSYLRTYKPKGYDKVVTGVISDNPSVYDGSDDAHAVRHKPTDYMILNGSLNSSTGKHYFRLVTTDVVDDLDGNAANDVHHTVTSFENYWKTNPTAANVIHDKDNSFTVGTTPTDAQITAALTTGPDAIGWHTYNVWANGSTWTSTSKSFGYGPHWFQTIDVGTESEGVYNGDFDLEEYDLDGALILLDQHGWEVMRKPITNLSTKKAAYATELRKYDSPMVKKYHFWTNFKKEDGYHKYKPVRGVSSSKDAQHKGEGTSLANYPEVFSGGTLADIYVTYEVIATYRDSYTGAATQAGTTASKYLIRQGTSYAKTTDGSTITLEAEASVDLTAPSSIGNELLWYVKPNFNIDTEMGYQYEGSNSEKTQLETESAYFSNTAEDAVYDKTNGQNGFDPYNLQIESAKTDYSGKLFTTNATGARLDNSGGLASTYEGAKTVTLQSYSTAFDVTSNYYDSGTGYQIPHVTNSTFMAVSDGNGNIRLMPRFDHHNVATSFATLDSQQAAASYGDESGTQTTLFILPSASSPTPPTDPIDISSSDEIIYMNGHYRLNAGFVVTKVIGTAAKPFTGIIDGQLNTIDGLNSPLVAYADGATIKNVIVKNASINAGNAAGNAGAICCQATGDSRIYNCGILPTTTERDKDGNITGFSGSHVSGTDNVGGIVGLLDGTSRVINCFSYATITGGTTVAGIVGNNTGTTTATSITTMVMNCMFYGDITGGTTVSPVYGGNNIDNLQGGLNTFNYYSYENLKTKAISDGEYNCALAVEEKYLNRFEFYRLLLNSNKKLATFYVTGSAADENLMEKWVLETADRRISGRDPYPYPILKAQGYYPSIINMDVTNAPDSTTVGRNHGGKLGKTLTVNISGTKTDGGQSWPTGAAITTPPLTLQRTDKDFDRFNYNYDKVQLPYYNDVGSGNYTENRVVTGWKITAITQVEDDPYTASNYPSTGVTDYPNHNYADRKSSNKDLYTVSGRVFSQGAYFDVPYGVTSITIEPYWGKAYYIADQYYDVVYKNDYSGKQGVSQTGTQVNTSTTKFNGQKVETSITRSLDAIASTGTNGLGGLGPTVYDNALVLVGNLHLDVVPLNGDRPFTMMSVDADNDHEPDYSLIYHHKKRSNITPIRFDFLNIPGTAQAQKPNGASLICNFTIFKTRGWFEITNTALVHSDQLEYENAALDNNATKIDAPLILLGGDFDQFVSTQSSEVAGHTIYIHVGSNVWIHEFGLGTHSDGSKSTPHVPVSVTGGEFPGFYLTGTYNANADVTTDNAECYISGGYFHEAAGASLEQINGNVRWQIYNADIDEFFGGGINEAKPIKGDITVDIYNSHVTLFCGGPKFGNMQANKNVTTNAEGCTFGKFFGAGYGGTSISKKKYYDNTTPAWGTTLQGYYTTDRGLYFDGNTTNSRDGGTGNNQYGKKGLGIATDFDYEFFVWSTGETGGRFYVKFAAFSLAQCNDVSSTLKNCTVNENFYGGGSLGKVVGTITSELDNCTVKGNVFGAGYSASLPTLQVRDAGFTKKPNYNSASGMFEPGTFSGTSEFTWRNISDAAEDETTLNLDNNGKIKNGTSGSNLSKYFIYTDIDLSTSNLGSVNGDVNLTIKGNSVIGTEGDTTKGNVYGGGEQSYVTGTEKMITVNLEGNTQVYGNVFGGGDEGVVEGSTTVNIRETPTPTPDPTPDPEP